MTLAAGVPGARTIRRARIWLVRRLRRGRGDGGFILLESMIAITVITIVMSAVGAEFVSSMISASQQRAKQGAVQVADSAVEQLRSLHASDLLRGRACPAVQAQLSAASSAVTPWLANMSIAVDSNYAGSTPTNPCASPPSGTGATPIIPTSGVTQTPNKVSYTVTDYLGWCWIAGGSGDCTTTQSGVRYLRAVVAVTWSAAHCSPATCAYVTSTLISTTSDPTFQVNQPLPASPAITSTADQTVVIGDAVNLQLAVRNNTGVPPFTWALQSGPLPTGLQLSPTGLISGTVGGSAGSYPVTVKVTDAFLRTDAESFTWNVKPPVTATTPAAQVSTVNTTITPLTLSASGGTGGYTWTDPASSLPGGLSINGSQITGWPTATGTFAVKLTVTDSTNHSKQISFSWAVYPAATITGMSSLSATEGQNVEKTLPYTCPGMTCTLTLTGTVPGLGLATNSATGNNTATSLTVNGNGTVHVTGTVQSNAVTSGSSNPYAPVVTITNPAGTSKQTTATWTMYAPPTIAFADNSAVTAEGAAPSEAINYTCATSSCTITLDSDSTVPGLGLSKDVAATTGNATTSLTVSAGSDTVYLNGLIDTSAVAGNATVATYTPDLTITDTDSFSAPVASETWSVYVKPTIGSPGNKTVSRWTTVSQPVSFTCNSQPCTLTALNLPNGLALSKTTINSNGTGTVYITGTVSYYAAQRSYTVTVKIDNGSQVVSSVGVWTVN